MVWYGYLVAATPFGLTRGETATAILGIALVAGAVKAYRERRRQRAQKEARRYDFLIERERRGEIRDLRLQVDFTLQEAYTDAEGRRVRAIRYRADFTYYEGAQGRQVVEDVKSRPTRTREYAMKKKMLKDRFGIDITEV